MSRDDDIATLHKKLAYFERQSTELAAENLRLDYALTGVRHELKQRRQGFGVLAQLQLIGARTTGKAELLRAAAEAINGTLGMDCTVLLAPDLATGAFRPMSWHGFHSGAADHFGQVSLDLPASAFESQRLVTLATPVDPVVTALREQLKIPYFIATPVMLDGQLAVVLVSGRLKEARPLYPPLDASDSNTFLSISAFLTASLRITRRTTELERALTQLALSNERLQAAKEAADAANDAKSEFLANMSHEIRTPMHGVLGMTDLLLTTSLNDRQDQLASNIRRSASSLLTIISDILDFSKVEAGLVILEDIEFELVREVSEVVELLTELAHDKGLELRLSTSEVPTAVRGDPMRLRQVLTNLVANAIKFTERGRVEVTLTPQPGPTSTETMVRLEVTDTGIGLDPEASERIFEAFRQADGSTTRRFGGTGLGLAIARQLVELMGGQIGVRSQPGQGSTFWFTANLRPVQQPTSPASSPLPAEPSSVRDGDYDDALLTGTRVLLVEDNPVNQKVAMAMLMQLGCEAKAVSNGQQACEVVGEQGYDVVFMDCQMPVMDGFEATAWIRQNERHEGRDPLPIIALTANAMKQDRERCLEMGMNDFLSKPFTLTQLAAMLHRWRPSPGQEPRSGATG